MSRKRSDNNNNRDVSEDNSLMSTDSQLNNEQNINNNELLSALSNPSFLSTNCSVPTELFNTLSPISLSQITSQSTPFIPSNRNDFRREPMGSEYEDNRNNALMKTYSVETQDETEGLILRDDRRECLTQTTNRANDRPPLVGQSANTLTAIGSRVGAIAQTSVEPIEEVSDDEDRDALAAKVELLLGRTNRELVDEDFDVESLGLIRVIRDKDVDDSNESSNKTSDAIVEAERSEPDGKGKPYQTVQQRTQMSTEVKKLVHYSSSESESESEDNKEESSVKTSVNSSPSTSSQQDIPINTLDLIDTGIRYRSYSASGSTGIANSELKTNIAFGVSSFLREKIQRKQISQKDSSATGTQTLRSFLAEQALQQKIEDSSSHNTSTIGSSGLELQKSTTSNDGEPIGDSINNVQLSGSLLPQEFQLQLTNQNYSQQFIYIPTGMKKDLKSSQNGSDISSGAPLSRVLDVFKASSSETSTKSSSSSSEGQKENRPINNQSLRHSSNSTSSKQNASKRVQQNLNEVNQESKAKSKSKSQNAVSSEQNPVAHSSNTRSSSPKKNKQHTRNESATDQITNHHERQFKYLVERQKNYLKCLQKELVRLEKMEKLFAKLHASSRNSHQSKPVRHSNEAHNQRDSTTSMSNTSTNDHISSKQSTTNKSSLIISSDGTPAFSPLSETQSNYFENTDRYSCDTTSKSSIESSTHRYCHHNHRHNSHPTCYRHTSPKKKHILPNKAIPKHIQGITSTKPVKKTHTSKAIQTSQSLLNLNLNSLVIDYVKPKDGIETWQSDENHPLAWFIPIDRSTKRSSINRTPSSGLRSQQLSRERIKQTSTPLSLQEAFNRNCNKMRIQSQIRINRINIIAEIRKRTAEERLIEMTKSYARQQQTDRLMKTSYTQPAYKTNIKRVFTHQEMRAQTEKIYVNLPEVRALREKKKKEEKERNQRLMAQIYKYRLKDNALKGKVTWKITQSCLSY